MANTVVIGRYDKNACGGCDAAIKNGDELKETLAKVMRELSPDAIVFEGVMYGKSVDFTNQVYLFCKRKKADFTAICLEPSFEMSLQRIYERNGGKEINVKSLENGWRASIKSNKKLREMGVPTVTYNTGNMTKQEMGMVLEDVL